jgi:site-specific DNA recombinase
MRPELVARATGVGVQGACGSDLSSNDTIPREVALLLLISRKDEQIQLDGYIRVSVVGGREGERFQSPAVQREAIARWAEYRGISIGEWHEDLDRSGGTLDRAGLQAILARIEDGETGGIVVSKLDRLSRSVMDGLGTIERVEAIGGQVASVSEGIDTTSANGKLQLTFFLAIAEWYRNTVKEQWAATQAFALKRGALPGRTPYGTTRLENGTVELNDETAAVVARMVTERADGKGWKAIATGLSKDGIPSPGNGQWAATTVQSIVQSEACLGVWNGPLGARVDDAWPAMVSREIWDAAKLVKGKRNDARNYQDRLLAGIARCAGCRRTLKRTTNQQGHVSYGCTNRECPARASVGVAALDAYVSEALDARLRRLVFEATHPDDDVYLQLLEARNATQIEFERWRDDTDMRAIIGDDDYRAGLAARAKVRDEANERFHQHTRTTRSGLLPEDRSVTMAELPWERQQQVAGAYLYSVFIKRSAKRGPHAARNLDERVKLVWTGDRDLPELPTPVSGPLAPIDA